MSKGKAEIWRDHKGKFLVVVLTKRSIWAEIHQEEMNEENLQCRYYVGRGGGEGSGNKVIQKIHRTSEANRSLLRRSGAKRMEDFKSERNEDEISKYRKRKFKDDRGEGVEILRKKLVNENDNSS